MRIWKVRLAGLPAPECSRVCGRISGTAMGSKRNRNPGDSVSRQLFAFPVPHQARVAEYAMVTMLANVSPRTR